MTGAIQTPDDFDQDDYCRTNPRFHEENFRRSLVFDRNAAAADISLSPDIVHALQNVFPPDATAGERHVPAMTALINGSGPDFPVQLLIWFLLKAHSVHPVGRFPTQRAADLQISPLRSLRFNSH